MLTAVLEVIKVWAPKKARRRLLNLDLLYLCYPQRPERIAVEFRRRSRQKRPEEGRRRQVMNDEQVRITVETQCRPYIDVYRFRRDATGSFPFLSVFSSNVSDDSGRGRRQQMQRHRFGRRADRESRIGGQLALQSARSKLTHHSRIFRAEPGDELRLALSGSTRRKKVVRVVVEGPH